MMAKKKQFKSFEEYQQWQQRRLEKAGIALWSPNNAGDVDPDKVKNLVDSNTKNELKEILIDNKIDFESDANKNRLAELIVENNLAG